MITVREYENCSQSEKARIYQEVLDSDEYNEKVAFLKTPEDFKIEWEKVEKIKLELNDIYGDILNWPVEELIYRVKIRMGYILLYQTPDLKELPENLAKAIWNAKEYLRNI